jgi:isoleucyl-tRNA synthetase
MIVDQTGEKFSKSKGNGISPKQIIDKYGADMLRLWVVSADYKTDMRISDDILKQLSEAYRKIRNTARFILGNISDFDPDTNMVSYEEMSEIDKWALIRLNKVVEKVVSAYEAYEFHMIYHNIHNFCVVDMSNVYLDIIKDRLYTEKADSKARRSAQSAMYIVLDTLVRLIAPVLCYTSEEIWSYMPHKKDDERFSVVMNDMPKVNTAYHNDEIEAKWDKLLEVRERVLKALEEERAAKRIGKSLEAKVTISADADYDFLKNIESQLAEVFIVSDAEVVKGEDSIAISAAEGTKCERCWTVSKTVGKVEAHPTICARCAANLQ